MVLAVAPAAEVAALAVGREEAVLVVMAVRVVENNMIRQENTSA